MICRNYAPGIRCVIPRRDRMGRDSAKTARATAKKCTAVLLNRGIECKRIRCVRNGDDHSIE